MKYLFGILLILAQAACGSGDESQQQSDNATEAASQELQGPDLNGNGVRDDVDEWIASVEDSQQVNDALVNYARALEGVYDFYDYENEEAYVSRSEERRKYHSCVLAAISGLSSADDFIDVTLDEMNRWINLSKELRSRIFNTKERYRKYIEVNNLMGGHFIEDFDRYEECE